MAVAAAGGEAVACAGHLVVEIGALDREQEAPRRSESAGGGGEHRPEIAEVHERVDADDDIEGPRVFPR